MRIGSLFSGAGGLDLAVQAVFGGEVVWHAEIDKAASKVLAYRWPDVPNLGDISAVAWDSVPPVDILCGGFPCQDVSAAGKRAGIKDGTRSGLWAVMADAIDALRPPIVVIENVRGLLSALAHRNGETDDERSDVESGAAVVGDGAGRPVLRAAGAVLGDLADLGYDAQWATVAAADVGAPHRRERVFIVATDTSSRELQRRRVAGIVAGATSDPEGRFRDAASGGGENDASHSSRYGWDEGRPEPARLERGFDVAVRGDGHGVELLPTPRASDPANASSHSSEGFSPQLGEVVRQLGVQRGLELVDVGVGEDDGAVPVFPADGGGDDAVVVAGDGEGVAVDVGGGVDGHNACLPLELAGTKQEPAPLLPTPNAQDGNGGGRYSSAGHQSTLPGEVRLLPTPRSSRGASTTETAYAFGGVRSDDNRTQGEVLLPTPRSSDCFGAGQHGDGGMDLRTTVSLLPTPRSHRRDDCKSERERNDPDLEATTHHFPRGQWGKYEPAIRRWENLTRPAPPPTEPNKNGNPRLSAAFSEWLMGWPAGWVTDPAIGISRNDQLRIVGNGVCPQQAAHALRYLMGVA